MSKVDRREFLKLVGAGSVGAGAGFMLAESIKHPVEHLIPYPVPPEEFSPGIATWYNSVCGMCPAGCGISVRTREGRAKKIEGNPLHPVNQGRLCALGQAGLQLLYNPDRITSPTMQTADRGSDNFVPATWDDGLSMVAGRLTSARDGDGDIVFLGDGVRGHAGHLLDQFMGELGSGQLLHYEYAHPHSLYAANKKLFGEDQLPYYDIANAHMLLSFGADYLNNWLSPVHYGLGFGRGRQSGDSSRLKTVQIEPRMSISGAAADEWIPARPGTEGFLALGIAHQIVANGVYQGADAADWITTLAPYSIDQVAQQTGVPDEVISHLADEFAQAEPGLAIGGGAAAGHSNGVDTLVAINALNYLVGNVGKPGGMVFNPDPANGLSANHQQASYQSMQDLVERAQQGSVAVLIVSGANPVFSLPHASGFAEALQSIPFVVSLSSLMDDTTQLADIILPSHTYLESWGDDMPQPGVGFSVGAISQPVVAPLYNTRATGDIVLGLVDKMGGSEAMPWTSTEDFLKDRWQEIYLRGSPDGDQFDDFWREVLISGVWGENTRRDDAVVLADDVVSGIDVAAPQFSGSAADYPFVLHPYLSTSMYDGRGANLPWMQELPDPMTSVVYGSWIEINPATAASLSLRDGDLVQISSEHGTIEAPVLIFPAIMPDVVAMPIGQGHSALGRYARNRGANPIQILAPQTDDASGALADSATRVSLVTTGKRAEVVRTGGESRQLGRNIVRSTGGSAGPGDHSASLNSIPIVVEPA